MINVALYIRVSTDEQAKSGYSLGDQRRELQRHAEREGYTVVEVLVDDGYSGASRSRPGLDRVVELAESGAIDLAIAVKRDRWFRSRLYRLMLDEDLEEIGVRLVALNDTGNRIGDGVQDDFAEWEREIITERMLNGRKARARSGKVVPANSPPYGFRYSADREHLEVEPAQMIHVRRIFDMAVAGSSLRGIALSLEADGVPSPFGKQRWSPYMIKRIVTQDAYRPHSPAELEAFREEGIITRAVLDSLEPGEYGLVYYGREETRRTRKGRKLRERPRSEWIAVPVPSSGVPQKIVDDARAAISGNVRPSRADGRVWVLSGGIGFCACGRRLLPKRTSGRSGVYHYLVCTSYWSSSMPVCEHAKSHPAFKTEDRVSEFVLGLIRNPEVLREKVEQQAETERRRLGSADREAEKLRGQLAEADTERERLMRRYMRGGVPDEEFDSYADEIDQRKHAIRRELVSFAGQDERLRQLEALPNFVEEFLRELPHLVDYMPIIRDYETVPAERTLDNPLGLYRPTAEHFRLLSQEEQEAERLVANNRRSEKLRRAYEAIGLTVTAHKDGTLVCRWSFGEQSLPGVKSFERSL